MKQRDGTYRCDICGKVSHHWGDSWRMYASIRHIEECPYEVPTVCSPTCLAAGRRKVKEGTWVLPHLVNRRYYSDVVHPGRGYGGGGEG